MRRSAGFTLGMMGIALSGFVLAPNRARAAPEPQAPPEKIVFELKYHGLDNGAQEEYGHGSYWGFSTTNSPQDDFTKSLKLPGPNVKYAQNHYFPSLGWIAVEYDGKMAKALYIDVNGDAKLEENEKILPAKQDENQSDFVTPDLTVKNRDGREGRYRFLIRAPEWDLMWASSCAMEGEFSLNGKPCRVALLDGSMNGEFDDFGRDRWLMGAPGEAPKSWKQFTLSRVMRFEDGGFYRLEFAEDGKTASLQKDETPLGVLETALEGQDGLALTQTDCRLEGGGDGSIMFDVNPLPGERLSLPEGTYAVASGSLGYKGDGKGSWQVDYEKGPPIRIDAAQPCALKLGRPKMTVSAIDEKVRYGSNAKPATTFKKGAGVNLSREIKGQAGEVYGRLVKGNDYNGVKPKVAIRDAAGHEVANGAMEYG